MTDYDVLYRGVPVPDSVLSPNLLGSSLPAFKSGVDAAIQVYGPQESDPKETDEDMWDYFCDEEDPNDPVAYFRRIKKGVNDPDVESDSQFLGHGSGWRFSEESRGYLRSHYRPVAYKDLPDRVKNADVRGY